MEEAALPAPGSSTCTRALLLPCRRAAHCSSGSRLISRSILEGLGEAAVSRSACIERCFRSRPQTLLTDLSNSFMFLPRWKVLFRAPCDKTVSGFLKRWHKVYQLHSRVSGSRAYSHLAPSGTVPASGWKGEGMCSAP